MPRPVSKIDPEIQRAYWNLSKIQGFFLNFSALFCVHLYMTICSPFPSVCFVFKWPFLSPHPSMTLVSGAWALILMLLKPTTCQESCASTHSQSCIAAYVGWPFVGSVFCPGDRDEHEWTHSDHKSALWGHRTPHELKPVLQINPHSKVGLMCVVTRSLNREEKLIIKTFCFHRMF